MLVIFGACAGLCYSALWFFPGLILIGGIVTAMWDIKLRQIVARVKRRRQQRRDARRTTPATESRPADESAEQGEIIVLPAMAAQEDRTDKSGLQRRTATAATPPASTAGSEAGPSATQEMGRASGTSSDIARRPTAPIDVRAHVIPVRTGIIIIVGFFGAASTFPMMPHPLMMHSYLHHLPSRPR